MTLRRAAALPYLKQLTRRGFTATSVGQIIVDKHAANNPDGCAGRGEGKPNFRRRSRPSAVFQGENRV